MRRFRLLKLLTAGALAALLTVTASASFSDTRGHWAETIIDKWSEGYGILGGYSDGTFHPDEYITRGAFAGILNRFMHYRDRSPDATFPDIEGNYWADAILRLHSAGVYRGNGGYAYATATITHQQAVTMISRAFDITTDYPVLNYDDAQFIESYARGPVAAMTDQGYLKNVAWDLFQPDVPITRAEMIQIFSNMIEDLVQTPDEWGHVRVNGNLMINSETGAYLTQAVVLGDLFIAPGVTGPVILEDMQINGTIHNYSSVTEEYRTTSVPTSAPTPIPTPTLTPTPLPTPVPVFTVTPIPPATVTDTPIPTATSTPVPTATTIPVPTDTVPVPTDTVIPTATVTETPVFIATPTPYTTPEFVPTVTLTPTPTLPPVLPESTSTPVPTPTFMPPYTLTATPTPTPSSIFVATPTPLYTDPEFVPTVTLSPTPTPFSNIYGPMPASSGTPTPTPPYNNPEPPAEPSYDENYYEEPPVTPTPPGPTPYTYPYNPYGPIQPSDIYTPTYTSGSFTYEGNQIPIYPAVPQRAVFSGDFVWSGSRIRYVGSRFEVAFGVDVSAHKNRDRSSGTLDWDAARRDGVEFAIVRIGARGTSSGSMIEDQYYAQNIRGSLAAGIQTGAYFFSQAITVEEALEEAEFVLQRIAPFAIDGPVCYDWEYETGYRNAKLSKEMSTACALAFCERVAAAGYTPIIYESRKAGYYKYDQGAILPYMTWYAQYPGTTNKTPYPNFYYQMSMWQFTDSCRVSGIGNQVDANLWFKTRYW